MWLEAIEIRRKAESNVPDSPINIFPKTLKIKIGKYANDRSNLFKNKEYIKNTPVESPFKPSIILKPLAIAKNQKNAKIFTSNPLCPKSVRSKFKTKTKEIRLSSKNLALYDNFFTSSIRPKKKERKTPKVKRGFSWMFK